MATYILSLHDALPISALLRRQQRHLAGARPGHPGLRSVSRHGRRAEPAASRRDVLDDPRADRSEEHTSELQSQFHLVCRLLLVKNNTNGGSGVNMENIISLLSSYEGNGNLHSFPTRRSSDLCSSPASAASPGRRSARASWATICIAARSAG